MATPRRPASTGAALILAGAIAAGACAEMRESRTTTRTIELDGAESATVDFRMGAGELNVTAGGASLMDATFRFNIPSWEPVVEYQSGANATLRVRQPTSGASFGRTENRWDVRLTPDVPIDLVAGMGAAQATMRIGDLDLKSVSIEQGVGELDLDLRGTPRRSYDVQVKGGVGSARIQVPAAAGVSVTVTSGIGSVHVRGLEQRGETWINPGHEDDPIAIHLDVKSGVGEVEISADAAP